MYSRPVNPVHEDKLRFIELLLTVGLVFLACVLSQEALSPDNGYLVPGLILGFAFSWFKPTALSRLVRLLNDLAVLGASVWICYSILNSFLIYQEIIVIALKGVIVLEITLSFNSPFSLSYLQALSLPLFMGSVLFAGQDSEIPLTLVTAGYLFCWLAISKIKFCAQFNPASGMTDRARFFYRVSLLIFFIFCFFLSWVLFTRFSPGPVKKGGILPDEPLNPQMELKGLEQQYYDLQDKVQSKLTDYTLELESAQERRRFLGLLNTLIKESPHTLEVQQAELGLTSPNQAPGPGMKKAEGEELTFLLKKIFAMKTALILSRAAQEWTRQIKNAPLSLAQKFSVLSKFHKARSGDSYQDVRQEESALRRVMDSSFLTGAQKNKIAQTAATLAEWKAYDLYRLRKSDLEERLASFVSPVIRQGFSSFISDIDKAADLAGIGQAEQDIRALKETGSAELREHIVKAEETKDLKVEMIFRQELRSFKERLESLLLPPHELEKLEERIDTIYTPDAEKEFLSVLKDADLPQEISAFIEAQSEVVLREQKEELNIAQIQKEQKFNAKLMRDAAGRAVLPMFVGLALAAALFFLAFYFLRERKKRKIMALYGQPKEFILSLYENAQDVLSIFGLPRQGSLPYLSYARLVEDKFVVPGNYFLGLTVKFQEAKYSRHGIGFADASLVLRDYNRVVQGLAGRERGFRLFLRYLSAFWRTTPFFIR